MIDQDQPEVRAAKYAEALSDIADALDLPTGATPDEIVDAARNQWARGIHTCHEKCGRPLCVAHRRIREVEKALAAMSAPKP